MIYLTTTKAVRDSGFVDDNVAENDILSAIKLGQEIELEYVIGSNFYERILHDVESKTLNEAETKLLKGVIKDLLIHYSVKYLLQSKRLRISNQSVNIPEAENMKSADIQAVNYSLSSIKNITLSYELKLKKEIDKLQYDFPEINEDKKSEYDEDDMSGTSEVIFDYTTL